ncbi:MAG: trypsin-like peptidase domain-containing protein [Planctomycetes bacterium]|nr:trypsin-like peptidase domain-containing protein [Planctomycetota bacterium]
MFSRRLLVIFVVALATGSQAGASEPKKIYRQAVRATALVRVKTADRTGYGTAWVVNREKGLLITNYHVIEEVTQVQVQFPIFRGARVVADRDLYKKETPLTARVLASDPRCDLALLHLPKIPDGVAELKLAAESAEPGERVHSVGHPGASAAYWVYSQGLVRQVAHRKIAFPSQVIETMLVEIQSPVNPGDSGSALVNDRGEVVAVVSATNHTAQLFGLAIDVSRVRHFLTESTTPAKIAAVR